MALNFVINGLSLIVQNYIITVIVVRTLTSPSRWSTGVRQADSFFCAVAIVNHTWAVEKRALVGNCRHAIHLVVTENWRWNALFTLSVDVYGFHFFPVDENM